MSISAGKWPLLSALRVAAALACLALVSANAASARPVGPAGGGSIAASTFSSQTAYLDDPPPSVAGAITVSSASAFASAIDNAQAGDTINVLGNVRIPGEFAGFGRVIPGGVVNVVFRHGAGFTGMGGSQLPAIWLRNSGGWRIWGGTISNPDGNGILAYAMPGPFTWTGFTVRNTGDTCVAVYPVWGNIDGLVLKGVAGTADPNLASDPHVEKGTGIHAWNIGDATGGLVENSTFATDTRNQATGAAVEIDTGQIGPNVTVYARAKHLGFAVPGTTWTGDAKYQVAGNVLQLWGSSVPPGGRLKIGYVEGTDIQGRIVETDGMYASAAPTGLSAVSIDYGKATGPILQNRSLSKVAYAVIDGLDAGVLRGR
ncbi:MAG: hypothetical protein E6F98_10925 [Actinobacteria bacterium]|nr:MAG: hypothetical protein E6F98_10925 [Actinomycetota bacterium]